MKSVTNTTSEEMKRYEALMIEFAAIGELTVYLTNMLDSMSSGNYDSKAVDDLAHDYHPNWLKIYKNVIWQIHDDNGNVVAMNDEQFKKRALYKAVSHNCRRQTSYKGDELYFYIDAFMYDRMNEAKCYKLCEEGNKDD